MKPDATQQQLDLQIAGAHQFGCSLSRETIPSTSRLMATCALSSKLSLPLSQEAGIIW